MTKREREIARKCERERERKERRRGREIAVARIPEMAKGEGENDESKRRDERIIEKSRERRG